MSHRNVQDSTKCHCHTQTFRISWWYKIFFSKCKIELKREFFLFWNKNSTKPFYYALKTFSNILYINFSSKNDASVKDSSHPPRDEEDILGGHKIAYIRSRTQNIINYIRQLWEPTYLFGRIFFRISPWRRFHSGGSSSLRSAMAELWLRCSLEH